ncbi:helix-turn-helix transcriptional regulator [Pseudoclavibacter soli]|uniref:helix-turn-helix transcriptional regulator n=1 Tax=Pseudoclavibacter soli TaxID=452623 RepID=UPI000480E0E1|nr:helix-turn-helix transcriptional regulator [Pseudoclavibacter soli]
MGYIGEPAQVVPLPPRADALLTAAHDSTMIRAAALRRLLLPAPVRMVTGVVGSAKHHLIDAALQSDDSACMLRVHLGPRHTTVAGLAELLLSAAAEQGRLHDPAVLRQLQRHGALPPEQLEAVFDELFNELPAVTVVIEDLQWLTDAVGPQALVTAVQRWPQLRLLVTTVDDAALQQSCTDAHVSFTSVAEHDLFYTRAEVEQLCVTVGVGEQAERCWQISVGHPLTLALCADLLGARPYVGDAEATAWIGAMIARIASRTLPDLRLDNGSGIGFAGLMARCSAMPAFTRSMLAALDPDAHRETHLNRLLDGPMVEILRELLDGEPVYRWRGQVRQTFASIARGLQMPPVDAQLINRYARQLATHGFTEEAIDLLLHLQSAELLESACAEHLLEIVSSARLLRELRASSITEISAAEHPHFALLRLISDVLYDVDPRQTSPLVAQLRAAANNDAVAPGSGFAALVEITALALALLDGDLATASRLAAETTPAPKSTTDSPAMVRFTHTWWLLLRAFSLLCTGDLSEAHHVCQGVLHRSPAAIPADALALARSAEQMIIAAAALPQSLSADPAAQPSVEVSEGGSITALNTAFQRVGQCWMLMDAGRFVEAGALLDAHADEPLPGPASTEHAVIRALLLLNRDPELALELARQHRVAQELVAPDLVSQRLLFVEVVALTALRRTSQAQALLNERAADRPSPARIVAQALVYLATGADAEAHAALASARQPGTERFAPRSQWVWELLSAAASARLGQAQQAVTHLHRLVDLQPATTVPMLFVMTAPTDVAALICLIENQTTPDPRDAQALAWLRQAEAQGLYLLASPQRHGEPSQRELQVLEGLRAGLSYSEIAAKLYVSPNTVKSQVRSLYAKLGADGRSEAIAKANLLGW